MNKYESDNDCDGWINEGFNRASEDDIRFGYSIQSLLEQVNQSLPPEEQLFIMVGEPVQNKYPSSIAKDIEMTEGPDGVWYKALTIAELVNEILNINSK